MQNVACHHCGSSTSRPYAEENGFQLVKCGNCGLLYVNPRPDDADITQAHRTGLHSGSEALEVTGAFIEGKADVYLRVLEDVLGGAFETAVRSWLDIGCGHGEFLTALRRFSDNRLLLRGVEPNTHKVQSARGRGLDVHETFPTASDKYDVISLLNVYSHLPDPAATLREWMGWLKPGGFILMETGDSSELSARDHHRPFYLPDHLSFASEKIVREMLTRLGFRVHSVFKYAYREDLPPRRPSRFVKELIKAFLPARKSRFLEMLDSRQYAKRDMYVWAQTVP